MGETIGPYHSSGGTSPLLGMAAHSSGSTRALEVTAAAPSDRREVGERGRAAGVRRLKGTTIGSSWSPFGPCEGPPTVPAVVAALHPQRILLVRDACRHERRSLQGAGVGRAPNLYDRGGPTPLDSIERAGTQRERPGPPGRPNALRSLWVGEPPSRGPWQRRQPQRLGRDHLRSPLGGAFLADDGS